MGKSSQPTIQYATSPYAQTGANLLTQMLGEFNNNWWAQANLLSPGMAQFLTGNYLGQFLNSAGNQSAMNNQAMAIGQALQDNFIPQEAMTAQQQLDELNNNNLVQNTLQNQNVALSALGLANTPALQNADANAVANIEGQQAQTLGQLSQLTQGLALAPSQLQKVGEQLQLAQLENEQQAIMGIKGLQDILTNQLLLPYQAQLQIAQGYMGTPTQAFATQQQSLMPSLLGTAGMLGSAWILGSLL